MPNKAAIVVVLGLGAVAGTVILVARAKEAAEPEIPGLPGPMVPTPSDILAARTLGELEVWYIYIGQLLVTGTIDEETYEELYGAYSQRWRELVV